MRKKAFRRVLSAILCAASLASMAPAAGVIAASAAAPDFPDAYPADKLIKLSDAEISVKVEALLKSMTTAEIYSMLGGSSASASAKRYGTGYVKGVPRLGVPIMRMWDGPKGVISNGALETTSPASELAVASSFSRDLAYRFGEVHGSDNKATAGNVQLGMQLDIVRAPFFMRGRDSFGEDPYLAGAIASAAAKGNEDENALAVLKHMAAYVAMMGHPSMGSTVDEVTVDEQTLHEIYLAPYKKIIEDGSASAIMTSFNKVNGTFAALNSYLQKDVLRDMWGFKGLTMTDWSANTALSTHLGTDVEMPSISRNSQSAITAAIASGAMAYDDVIAAVRHTLTAMGQIGYLGLVEVDPATGLALEDPAPPAAIELDALEGEQREALLLANDEIALESAVKGGVLLKNEGAALPLTGADSIAVIGLAGKYPVTGHYSESSFGWIRNAYSAYDSLKQIMPESRITAEAGLDIVGEMVPSQYLFTSETGDENGVAVSYGGTKSGSETVENIDFTTGARAFKNSESGTALENGETATVTTYLKAPETGAYEFKMLRIGGRITASIDVGGTERAIPPTSQSGTNPPVQAADTNWPVTSAVFTPEGMDITNRTLSVNLVKDAYYRITVAASATSAAKDLQFRLTWFGPGQSALNIEKAVEAAASNDKVVVFMHDLAGGNRGFYNMTQRGTLKLPADQLDLLAKVAKAAKDSGNKVIAVLDIGLPVTMEWIDGVDAVLNMWLPGQQGGMASALLLAGKENPSGKLPVTFPADENQTQVGPIANSYTLPQANIIDEGIFCGYRWYDRQGLTPLFDFGHGLSYTQFEYSDLAITRTNDGEPGLDVSFTVKNTGSVAGSEVAQVYLGKADVPEGIQTADRQLAGFARIEGLAPGESASVTARVGRQSLSYWDPSAQLATRADGTKDKYVLALGERSVEVGAASDDIRLKGGAYIDPEIPVITFGEDTVRAAATLARPAASDAAIIVALYDAGGKLVAVASDAAELAAGAPTELAVEVGLVDGAASAKAFVWDRDAYVPLTRIGSAAIAH